MRSIKVEMSGKCVNCPLSAEVFWDRYWIAVVNPEEDLLLLVGDYSDYLCQLDLRRREFRPIVHLCRPVLIDTGMRRVLGREEGGYVLICYEGGVMRVDPPGILRWHLMHFSADIWVGETEGGLLPLETPNGEVYQVEIETGRYVPTSRGNEVIPVFPSGYLEIARSWSRLSRLDARMEPVWEREMPPDACLRTISERAACLDSGGQDLWYSLADGKTCKPM